MARALILIVLVEIHLFPIYRMCTVITAGMELKEMLLTQGLQVVVYMTKATMSFLPARQPPNVAAEM
jgi:hypothetical protein